MDNVIHKVLYRLGNLKLALITGDYAAGRDSGIIDLVMVGAIDKEYLMKCVEKVEKLIQRKVRTLVLSEEEFELNKESLHAERALVLWQEEVL